MMASDCPSGQTCDLSSYKCQLDHVVADASTGAVDAGMAAFDSTAASDAMVAHDAIAGGDSTVLDEGFGGTSDAMSTEDQTTGAADGPAEDAGNGATDAAPDEDGADGADGGPAGREPIDCDGGAATPSTLVLFGGGNATTFLGDTWIWNGASWLEVSDGGAPDSGPPARVDAAMSTACGVAVLAGGGGAPSETALPDAWTWNGSVWQPAPSAPPARIGAVAATLGSSLYLFGGQQSNGLLAKDSAELLAWSGSTWSSAPQSAQAGPSPRYSATIMNAPGRGLLLFGGEDILGNTFGDTWLLTGTGWELLAAGDAAGGPPARAGAAAAPWRNSVVLFGGADVDGNPLNDTWIWDGSTWTQVLQEAGGPDARAFHAMGALGDQVVLFGGFGNTGLFGDTWIWNGSWTPGPDAGPPARSDAAMTAY
jgi:hypothetical protein